MTKLLFALLTTLSLSAQAETQIEDWHHYGNIDAMTDEDSSTAITLGKDGGSLAVRCMGDDVMLISNADAYLGSSQSLPVAWRIDNNPAVTDSVPVQGTLAILPLSLMDNLEKGNRVLIRYTDYRGHQHTREFSLRGYYDATGLLSCVE